MLLKSLLFAVGMLRHQYISFRNFVGSNGAPQAVFTFLLVPCCLALNFTAPPLIPNIPFLWAWNAPTNCCAKIFDMPPDLSLFSLVGNPQKDVTGQPITLFYADRLGYYPNINESTGVHKNCGLPQVGSLKKHLDKAEKDIAYYMPIDNVGLAVIDWENWRPTWERNWKPKDVYKKESIELVLQQNLHLALEAATKRAKADFEKAAKSFMQDTLKLESFFGQSAYGVIIFFLIVTIIIITKLVTMEVALMKRKEEMMHSIGCGRKALPFTPLFI